MLRKLSALLALIIIPALLFACQKTDSAQAKKTPKQKESKVSPEESKETSTDTDTPDEKPLAVIETAKGTIEFKFFAGAAPKTMENFIKLADQGFYNGLNFHRVEPGFVIQGGDPNGNGTGGPGYNIAAEFNEHKHLTGTVAMARSQDINSAGSQFYVALAPQPFLDGKYTVFGQVTKGMDVVEKIAVGDVMTKVTIQK